ncbi:ECF transporter S component [Streptococcus dentasini]
MRQIRLHQLTLLALLAALSTVLGFIHIPSPTGFLTLLDAGVFFTAFYMGSRGGAAVGGISAFLLDLLLGYPQYMLFSLLAHGLQGLLAGLQGKYRFVGVLLASITMVGVYVLAALILGYGWGAAVAGIWGNSFQTILGAVIGFIAFKLFSNLFPKK